MTAVFVETKNGLIDREELVVSDQVHETEDARIIETVWMHNGEEVRRDATVSILRGLSSLNQQGL